MGLMHRPARRSCNSSPATADFPSSQSAASSHSTSRRFASWARMVSPRSAASGTLRMPVMRPPTIFPPMTRRWEDSGSAVGGTGETGGDPPNAGAPASRDGSGRAATVGGVTDARSAAAAVCADMRAGELLDSTFDRRVMEEYHLDARDRRWTRELVYGMLRQRSRLDAYLGERVRG